MVEPLYFLVAMALTLSVLAVLLAWLWVKLRRLERQVQEYRQGLERLGEDLAEFRTLSLQTEESFKELSLKLARLGDWLKERQDQGSEEPAYQSALEHIRQGADVEGLVESLGLSREEAALLIRLHGQARRRAY
jgi:uncharacterized protein HemX